MADAVWSTDGMSGDWTLTAEGDLSDTDPLGTAIVICLFMNKPLPTEGITARDQAAWHGATFDMEGEGEIGSYLWTLSRAIPDEMMLLRARSFCAQALQTLIDQKLVRGFLIDVELQKMPQSADVMLAISVVAIGISEQTFSFKFPIA